MRAKIAPLFFGPSASQEFNAQLRSLTDLLGEDVEFLSPRALGAPTQDADAALVPEMLGEAYRRAADFQALKVPLLVVTSEFGTVSMWDWEINSYLRSHGVQVLAPYNLEQTRTLCRALAVKRGLAASRLLVFQDNPGEGFQASIFKRFYWWEQECTQRMLDKFGIAIERRSFKKLGADAQAISDSEAAAAWEPWKSTIKLGPMPEKSLLSAVKVYLAVKREIGDDDSVCAVGINCLNESHFSDTTPCLAWNLLYEEKGLMWGCEGDTVSMLTEHLLHKCLGAPLMMTNLYPFLMGQAALKHERIPDFPPVEEEPENHILTAHCGYLGVLPRPFSTQWTLKKKVLAIVNDNATAIDARMAEGPVTLVKMESTFDRVSVVEAELTGYAQFKSSDCLNGAVVRVPDGRRLLDRLASHHYILAAGHVREDLELIGKVLGFGVDAL